MHEQTKQKVEDFAILPIIQCCQKVSFHPETGPEDVRPMDLYAWHSVIFLITNSCQDFLPIWGGNLLFVSTEDSSVVTPL